MFPLGLCWGNPPSSLLANGADPDALDKNDMSAIKKARFDLGWPPRAIMCKVQHGAFSGVFAERRRQLSSRVSLCGDSTETRGPSRQLHCCKVRSHRLQSMMSRGCALGAFGLHEGAAAEGLNICMNSHLNNVRQVVRCYCAFCFISALPVLHQCFQHAAFLS